jgi:linoleoyl-CoA desaturase
MITPKFARPAANFHADLNERVGSYFKQTNQKFTGNYKLFIKAAILITGFVATYINLVFFTPLNGYVAIAECMLLGVLLAGIGFNVMHDGAHGSFSNSPKLNDLAGSTLNVLGGNDFLWKQKHNMIHHSFTNINGVDEDIEIRPFLRLTKDQKHLPMHKYQHIYFGFLYGLLYLAWVLITDYKKFFRGKIVEMPIKKMNTKEKVIFFGFKAIHYGLFFVFPIIHFGFATWIVGFLFFALTAGFTLGIVFQLAHAVEDTHFPVPDGQSGNLDDEWAIHQIKTTANFATKNKIVTWFVGGLNFQIEHHLFPKISHVHYPQISEIVKKTCEDHGVEYVEYPNMRVAIASHYNFLKEMGKAA